jgi:KH domain
MCSFDLDSLFSFFVVFICAYICFFSRFDCIGEETARIEGTQEAVDLAIAKIQEIIKLASEKPQAPPPVFSTMILIPPQYAGLIIGRSGATIHGIMDTTKARVRVLRRASGEQFCEVTADSEESGQAAVAAVNQIISSPLPAQQNANQSGYGAGGGFSSFHRSAAVGGNPGGAGFRSGGTQRQGFNNQNGSGYQPGGASYGQANNAGGYNARNAGGYSSQRSGPGGNAGYNNQLPRRERDPQMIAQQRQARDEAINRASVKRTWSIDVASIGAILGPKGSTVRIIENETSTFILVNKETGEIVVAGDDEAFVQEALRRLADIAANPPPQAQQQQSYQNNRYHQNGNNQTNGYQYFQQNRFVNVNSAPY